MLCVVCAQRFSHAHWPEMRVLVCVVHAGEKKTGSTLGMQHTAMDSHVKVIPKRATGHYNFGDGILQAPYLNIEFTSGAGGMCSTVRDLYAFDRALYTDALVSQDSSREQRPRMSRASDSIDASKRDTERVPSGCSP